MNLHMSHVLGYQLETGLQACLQVRLYIESTLVQQLLHECRGGAEDAGSGRPRLLGVIGNAGVGAQGVAGSRRRRLCVCGAGGPCSRF